MGPTVATLDEQFIRMVLMAADDQVFVKASSDLDKMYGSAEELA